jgi:hypothetical protein
MRAKLEAWLNAAVATQGVVAAGVRLSEHLCLSRSADDRYPLDRLSMACQLAADIAALARAQDVATQRLLWRFREGDLHYTLRPDGVAAGLLTQPNGGEAPEFKLLVEVFLSLD